MKLSVIIPYYNAEPYTGELLDRLSPQITDEVEVIVVDDGSDVPFKTEYDWVKVIRKKNGGCATARNMGLDMAKGDYVSFLDADDLVPEYFIEKLFETMRKDADVIDFSWKSLSNQGPQHNYKLVDDNSYLPNPSVCTRAFKRSFIGNVRFNEQKDSTEDEDFSRKIGYVFREGFKHASIPEYMYYYRTTITDSKIKRFKKGLMKTKRVTYYYRQVTSDMTWLLDEIKKEDEKNEVWLLTNRCDIKEMRRYCQIHTPMKMWTHYLRGEPYNGCEIMPVPYDIVMYCEHTNTVGGISTFIYNFCQTFKDDYKILFLYNQLADIQYERISKIVECRRNDNREISCNTLILNRLTDKIPRNVTYKKTIQICHACVQRNYRIPKDRDFLVNVSESAKKSWGQESAHGIVIHNPVVKETNKALLLVSATRIGAVDKGSNDSRYRQLCDMLNIAGVPFVWLNFSDAPLHNPPTNFINMPARLNVQDFIARADYLVQLSDKEAYSYSILEALTNNTAVICTPFDSAIEQGVKDGKTGYIVPFDMNFDVTKLLKVPQFVYKAEDVKGKWKELIERKVEAPEGTIRVKVLKPYYDIMLKENVGEGRVMWVTEERAQQLERPHYLIKRL